MNNPQLNVYKPIGATPVEMINLLKKRFPEYSRQKISYAGRLDPMAHGVLILLIGDKENKARREREKSAKEYTFDVLFGISTDSYDILGIPSVNESIPSIKEIQEVLKDFKGEINQKLPRFCSYRIQGSPMYILAKEGRLKEQPRIKRRIDNIEIISFKKIKEQDLLGEILNRIALIKKDDFRQDIIVPRYKKALCKNRIFLLVKMKTTVSSGTYIRSICDDLGEMLNTRACAFEILRTRSGDHKLKNSLRL